MRQFAEEDFDDDELKFDQSELNEPTPGSFQAAQQHEQSAGSNTQPDRTKAPEPNHSWFYREGEEPSWASPNDSSVIFDV